MAKPTDRGTRVVARNVGYMLALILIVFAMSLLIASMLQGAPLLSAWYNASGVLVAAVGSVAVLSLIQSERQEAQRNDRESARLTLDKCQELAPLLTELEDIRSCCATNVVISQLQSAWDDSYSFSSSSIESVLRGMPSKWVPGYSDKIRLHPGSTIDLSDREQKPEELAQKTERALPAQLSKIRGGLSLTEPRLSNALGQVNLLSAYILEAKCSVDLATRAIGSRYADAMFSIAPLLAAIDAADHYPFLSELYSRFRRATGPANKGFDLSAAASKVA